MKPSSLPWQLKLASLSWIHSRFSASGFITLLKDLPANPTWSRICEMVEDGPMADRRVRWDKLEQLEAELLQVLENKGRLVCPLDPAFPQKLMESETAPALLSFYGEPVWNHQNCLAVVGARKILPDTLLWMNRELRKFLQGSRCCLVSGGAVGVDQEAHRLAIKSHRPTVIVLPSGLLNPYPASVQYLMELASDHGGAVLSCFPPYSQAVSNHFYRRNRLLIQLSESLLLTQAARRSGSHMSSLLALELGVDLGVVPGHPSEPGFSANLDLIHDGARVIRTGNDVGAMTS